MFLNGRTLKIVTQACLLGMAFYVFAWSQPYTTEDFIQNPSFETADDMGLPTDWKGQMEQRNFDMAVDTENARDGEQSLKIWVKEGGLSKDLMVNQDFAGQAGFYFASEKKLYCRAWVKYKEANSIAGFQLVIDQALKPGAPPWWVPIKWANWFMGAGTSDWQQVEGTVDYAENSPKGEPNAFIFRIFLNKNVQEGCTLWVDGIEIQTDPFDSVSVHKTSRMGTQSKSLSFQGNRVTFTQPTNYHVQIFAANGKQYLNRSGYGKGIDLHKDQLAPGCYVVKVRSDIGELSQPFVVQSH